MDDLYSKISNDEYVITAGDFNGHVSKITTDASRKIHRNLGYGNQNKESENLFSSVLQWTYVY